MAQSKSFDGVRTNEGSGSGEASLIDYLQFGRALGDQPQDVVNSLRARQVPVKRDSSAQDYIER